MRNKKVLVVLGGTSGERKVSLESGRACLKALKKLGYKTSSFDPKKRSLNLIDKNKVDVIFNALHGRDGEDAVRPVTIICVVRWCMGLVRRGPCASFGPVIRHAC